MLRKTHKQQGARKTEMDSQIERPAGNGPGRACSDQVHRTDNDPTLLPTHHIHRGWQVKFWLAKPA